MVVDPQVTGATQSQRASVGTWEYSRETLAFLAIQEYLCCPVDQRPLAWNENDAVLISSDGVRRYPVVDGIPCLYAPNEWPDRKSDVTEMVRSFYEETPFPNYDDLDGRESLQTRPALARQQTEYRPVRRLVHGSVPTPS